MRVAPARVGKIAFKMLQRQWYAKLAAEGFVDHEYGRDDGPLRVEARSNRLGADDRSTAQRGGLDALTYASTIEYYERCQEYLWQRPWTSFREREVWRRHSEGASLRILASELEPWLSPGCQSWRVKQVRIILARLTKDMDAWRAAGKPRLKAESGQLGFAFA